MRMIPDFLPEQRTTSWLKARLGNITASSVHKLMGSSRKADGAFSDTAMTELYRIAAERNLLDRVVEDDSLFDMYLDQTQQWSKAMQWGTEQEHNARELYASLRKVEVLECPSMEHQTIPFFSASPDGAVPSSNSLVEIKCPTPQMFMRYRDLIHDAASMREATAKSGYYWQVQTQLDIMEADFCDFVVYCPFERDPIFVTRIGRDGDAIERIEQRVVAANARIDEIINKNKTETETETDAV